jgi:hypothetical protein
MWLARRALFDYITKQRRHDFSSREVRGFSTASIVVVVVIFIFGGHRPAAVAAFFL